MIRLPQPPQMIGVPATPEQYAQKFIEIQTYLQNLVTSLEIQQNKKEFETDATNTTSEDEATAKAFFFDGNSTAEEADLSNLNASNLTSGTIPNARFPATLPALNGSNLTSLNASNLGSGTVPSARIGDFTNINVASINNAQIGGRRNLVLNGEFFIWQRGTGATTVSGNDVFSADRFKGWANGGGTFTVARSTDVPDNEFEFSAVLSNTQVDGSVSAGDFYAFATDIEGYNVAQLAYGSSDSKPVTLSFWVKASLTGTYCIALYSVTANRYQIKEYTISSANTWEKKTINISTGDTTGSWNRENGNGLRIYWDLGSGSTYQGSANSWASGQKFSTTNQANWIGTGGANLYLTGVQLEVGNTATEFEHTLRGLEEFLCRRYYYQWSGLWIGLMNNGQTTLIRHQLVFPVEMRTTPSVTNAGISSGFSIGTVQTNSKTHNFEFSATARVDFRPFMGSPEWKFTAEL